MKDSKNMIANIISNITDNYDFHRNEYMTIRPWIKARIEELDIDCEISYDNESLFLLKSVDDIEDEFTDDDIEDLIHNKRSTEFFREHIHVSGIYSVRVTDLLKHEHATTILWAMLDTLAIFERFDHDWTQKIYKWIDDDVIYMILRGMTKEEASIIEHGSYYLYCLFGEQGYSNDTTFDTIRIFIAQAINDKEGSMDYLKENPIFINGDRIPLNPRCFELDPKYWRSELSANHICCNYAAIEYLKLLDPERIDWINVSMYHRDVEFMETHIECLQLGHNVMIEENILMNDYMMPFIERHIDKFSPTILHVLSSNASAIEYLEQHPELVDDGILSNPNIVTYDYATIRSDHVDLHRELNEYLYHPSRIEKWLDGGNDIDDYMK